MFKKTMFRIGLGALSVAGLTAFTYQQTLSPQCDVSSSAAQEPAGRFAELHSCELFTGGCTASSQETQEGRYEMRVWQFDRGEIAGQPVGQLSVGLLETSKCNIAENHPANQAALYLPEEATPEQRAALTQWAQKNTSVNLATAPTKMVHFDSNISWEHTHISAGPGLSLSSTVPFKCDDGFSCGQSMWYTPRSANTGFIVDTTESAVIEEPALNLVWKDSRRPTVFIGYFGQPAPANMGLCGASVVDEASR